MAVSTKRVTSILIVVSWNNHHPAYCVQFIRACESFSEKIFVICPEQADPISRLGSFGGLAAKTEVLHFACRYTKPGSRNFRSLVNDFHDLRRLVASIREAEPTAEVFIFHSDLNSLFWNVFHLPLLAMSIRILFPWRFSGLLVAPDRIWPFQGIRNRFSRLVSEADNRIDGLRLLRIAFDRTLIVAGSLLRRLYLSQRNLALKRSRCEVIAVEDERYLDSIHASTGKATILLPETTSVDLAATPPPVVREIHTRRGGGIVVGLLGVINARKGIDLLVDVIMNHDTSGFLFVIAGQCRRGDIPAAQYDFLKDSHANHPNVIFSPNPIGSEDEFNAVIKACDLIYCVYKAHLHSSNVLSKAAAFGKPVLVSDGALMAERVQRYSLGCVLAEQTAESCLARLREMGTREYRERYSQTARLREYADDHSFKNLERVFGAMRQRILEGEQRRKIITVDTLR